MFKKNLRLPIDDFKKRKSKNVSSDFFSIKFSPNGFQYNRFGVIVSAKAEPKSSRRHLLKRKILEVAKKVLNLKTDFLVIALPKVKKIEVKNINQEINLLFSKITK